jgi:molybdate transport repressor ModE-like protein
MTLSPHVPDLASLELLLDVAQTGSLNRAAGRAGVSQQAASARIASMEAQTGVTLVHRTPRGSRLTAEGAVIAEWAARLLDVAAQMDHGIAALRQDRRSRPPRPGSRTRPGSAQDPAHGLGRRPEPARGRRAGPRRPHPRPPPATARAQRGQRPRRASCGTGSAGKASAPALTRDALPRSPVSGRRPGSRRGRKVKLPGLSSAGRPAPWH